MSEIETKGQMTMSIAANDHQRVHPAVPPAYTNPIHGTQYAVINVSRDGFVSVCWTWEPGETQVMAQSHPQFERRPMTPDEVDELADQLRALADAARASTPVPGATGEI